jgi:hypothetical protein
MRYIKKLALYTKNPADDRFSVLPDNRIVTNSVTSLEVPTGTKANRPATLVDGTVRYNTDLKEFEVYNSQNPGTRPWEILRTIRQATITPQNLGYGNYVDYLFGPLSYDVAISKPQNVLVFVDNVYQTPTTNYTLTSNPASTISTLAVSTTTGATTLYLNTLTSIDIGEPGKWRNISAPSGIQVGTTVTSVTTTFNNTFGGYPITISLATNGSISAGAVVSVAYSAGTYIQFTGPVPAKPVFALLGFDGYFPAGPSGTAFES